MHTYNFPEDEHEKEERTRLWDDGRMSGLNFANQMIQSGQPILTSASVTMETLLKQLRQDGANEQVLELVAGQFMEVLEERNRVIGHITRLYCGLESKYVQNKH